MKILKTNLLSIIILSLFFSIISPLGTLKSYAAESWTFDSTTGTLYVKEDIIVTQNGSGEYIAPYDAHKSDIKIVVLEETVNKIAFAFYGYNLERIIIKNKNINIATGLAGATVSIIEFTEDVSDMITREKSDNLSYYKSKYPGKNFTYILDKYYYQYEDARPFVITTLATDTNSDTEITKVGDSSNWNIWGLNDVVLIPNQTKDTAEALRYSFFMTNNNEYGKDFSSYEKVNYNEQKDKAVVYKIKASLKNNTYEAGTTLNPDDVIIRVIGIGTDEANNYQGSYWNYELNDWVWVKNNSITPNQYNLNNILENLCGSPVDGKYIIKGDKYFEYKDSYFLRYTNPIFGDYDPTDVFIGKYINGVIHYTYNGNDWIETTYTYSWDAMSNSTYTNDKGEAYPIYTLEEDNDNLFKMGDNFVAEYYYIENGNIYYQNYQYSQPSLADKSDFITSKQIGIGYYDETTGRYYDYDNAYEYSGELVKSINNKIHIYNESTEEWEESVYNTFEEYEANTSAYVYADATNYIYNEQLNIWLKDYYILEDGVWYFVDIETGNKIESYNEVYTNELYLPLDFDSLTNVTNTSASTMSASANTPQAMAVNNNGVTVVEGENIIELDYFGLKTTVTVTGTPSSNPTPPTPVTYTVKVVDKYYDENNQLKSENIRHNEIVNKGTSYQYNALQVDGYEIQGVNTYSGTVQQELELVFTYKKKVETPTTPPSNPNIQPQQPQVSTQPTNPELPKNPDPAPPAIKEDSPTESDKPINIPKIENETESDENNSNTEEFNKEDTISNNMKKSYKVTFMVDGIKYKEIFILEGEFIKLPEDPIKENYEFVKWDTDLNNIKEDTITNAVFKKVVENVTEKENISDFNNYYFLYICLLILCLLIPGLFLFLFLFNKNKIPFVYILNKELKEMIITGYKGKEKKVFIEEEYRPFIHNYTVIEIAENAFNGLYINGENNFNAEITEIHIPKTVRKIGKNAFKNCISLQKIILLNKNCIIDTEAFDEDKRPLF